MSKTIFENEHVKVEKDPSLSIISEHLGIPVTDFDYRTTVLVHLKSAVQLYLASIEDMANREVDLSSDEGIKHRVFLKYYVEFGLAPIVMIGRLTKEDAMTVIENEINRYNGLDDEFKKDMAGTIEDHIQKFIDTTSKLTEFLAKKIKETEAEED